MKMIQQPSTKILAMFLLALVASPSCARRPDPIHSPKAAREAQEAADKKAAEEKAAADKKAADATKPGDASGDSSGDAKADENQLSVEKVNDLKATLDIAVNALKKESKIEFTESGTQKDFSDLSLAADDKLVADALEAAHKKDDKKSSDALKKDLKALVSPIQDTAKSLAELLANDKAVLMSGASPCDSKCAETFKFNRVADLNRTQALLKACEALIAQIDKAKVDAPASAPVAPAPDPVAASTTTQALVGFTIERTGGGSHVLHFTEENNLVSMNVESCNGKKINKISTVADVAALEIARAILSGKAELQETTQDPNLLTGTWRSVHTEFYPAGSLERTPSKKDYKNAKLLIDGKESDGLSVLERLSDEVEGCKN